MKLTTLAKAEAISAALGKLTGARPMVVDVAGRAVIRWRVEDLPVARAWLERQLTSGGGAPGWASDVSIDLIPVVSPLAMRTVVPAILGVGLVGFILGRL